jgi:hypothetical protein
MNHLASGYIDIFGIAFTGGGIRRFPSRAAGIPAAGQICHAALSGFIKMKACKACICDFAGGNAKPRIFIEVHTDRAANRDIRNTSQVNSTQR